MRAQEGQRQFVNRNKREESYEVGEQALLSIVDPQLARNQGRKLGSKYIGPFFILEKIGTIAYKL